MIAIDLLDYRLEYSSKFGATDTINAGNLDVEEAVREITHGTGPDITVEAAGYPDTLDMALRLVTPFGKLIIFGNQSDDFVPVDTSLWFSKQPTIIPTIGARSPDPISHIKDIVALRARGWVDPAPLVTHRIGFNVHDVNTAYEMYEQRLDNIIKVVMSL